ncbi:hypothetical protein KIN20_027491 [Parelaphostrongylus tenuis]|uniref:Uncharacterized protein n=1 Tax=Parelaphostrongylus tenuis TaxID=148309 RepID=A0AAD5QZH0_PARTN|nr:hypothetical protein KIN20_027491 [Parelaphostrongylus tenuis]
MESRSFCGVKLSDVDGDFISPDIVTICRKMPARNNTCAVCHVLRSTVAVRWSSKLPKCNVLLLSCLVNRSTINMDWAVKVYSGTLQCRKRFCKDHYIEAGSFLGSLVRKRYDGDISLGFDGVPSYVLEEILAELAYYVMRIDEHVKLNTVDIMNFYKECLSKFKDMIIWKLMDQDFSMLQERVKQDLEAVDEFSARNNILCQAVDDLSARNGILCQAADEFTTNNGDSILLSEPNSSDTTMESNENDLDLFTIKLCKTESSLLEDLFVVKGRKLLNLFRFCPLCGMKLSQACLTAAGTAPIVDFICTACSPSMNRWNGQDSATDVP